MISLSTTTMLHGKNVLAMLRLCSEVESTKATTIIATLFCVAIDNDKMIGLVGSLVVLSG